MADRQVRRHADPLNALPAEAKARLRKRPQPEWVAPMLATLTQERFSREGWLFEPKWDGERCIAVRRGRKLSLFSRNRILLNVKYPEIVTALDQQETGSFIADGEIVTFKDGITSFAKLQERMQVAHPSPDLIRQVPVWLYLFDVVYFECYDTRQVPLRYRKELLRNAFQFKGSLRFTDHRETEGEAYYREACRRGWEGVIAKNGDSAYVSKRTRDWLKFKCAREQEFERAYFTPSVARGGAVFPLEGELGHADGPAQRRSPLERSGPIAQATRRERRAYLLDQLRRIQHPKPRSRGRHAGCHRLHPSRRARRPQVRG